MVFRKNVEKRLKVRMLINKVYYMEKLKYLITCCKNGYKTLLLGLSLYSSFSAAIRGFIRVLFREGPKGIIHRIRLLAFTYNTTQLLSHKHISEKLYGDIFENPNFNPKVSIIVPNYNHASYLRQRLNTIYAQTYSNYEVILLDDCSSDNSVEILQEYADRYPDKTVLYINEINSGGVFNQWQKGFEIATGELVWIAESDDYCTENLLENLIKFFQNSAVMLAFCRTIFVKGNPPVALNFSDEYLADLGFDIWDKPFVKSAHYFVKTCWAIKNVIPNVSSAIFRHPGKMQLLQDPEWLKLRVCGDWIFYLSIIRGGLLAYSPDAINYYRQHPTNTSVNAQREMLYYHEHEIVARYLIKWYHLDRSDLEKNERQLYQHWTHSKGDLLYDDFKKVYDIDKVWVHHTERKPNILMAVYALISGGGEALPIMLANLLYHRGYAVTLLNCNNRPTEPNVRSALNKSIPLLEINSLNFANALFSDMGVEIIHSHHASVDVEFATYLSKNKDIRHVVTMHGMYEMMNPERFKAILPILEKKIDCFVYVAEKNLSAFSPEFLQQKFFTKIENALQILPISAISRDELNISHEDFVLCFASRAIPEKGWEEAIKIIIWVNQNSSRKTHLLLAGEGPELDRLQIEYLQEYIHFLGFRSNIRDYFAAADLGFLPTKFKGESAPLMIIDSLYAGKPIIASNIGDVSNMLTTEQGMAGIVFDLVDWTVPVQTVGQLIIDVSNDSTYYNKLLDCVPMAAAKFDPEIMVDKYENAYNRVLN